MIEVIELPKVVVGDGETVRVVSDPLEPTWRIVGFALDREESGDLAYFLVESMRASCRRKPGGRLEYDTLLVTPLPALTLAGDKRSGVATSLTCSPGYISFACDISNNGPEGALASAFLLVDKGEST